MATEEERGEKEGVEGIKIEKLEANSTTPTTTTTTSLPSMSSKDLESTSTKTLVLGAPIIASPIRKADLKVDTTKKSPHLSLPPKVLALNNEEVEKERKPDSASKLKKKIKFAFKNKSSLRKMRVGDIKAGVLLKMNLFQESNGSVKAFESFHNVEREKIESPSRSRWDSLMRTLPGCNGGFC